MTHVPNPLTHAFATKVAKMRLLALPVSVRLSTYLELRR